jgi:hypothetical protein
MGLMSFFRRIDRQRWFVCYDCMQSTGHETERSIFYYDGPPVEIHGRHWYKCIRCGSLNTRSFQFLKDDGSEAQLFGLERIARSRPRRFFEAKKSA